MEDEQHWFCFVFQDEHGPSFSLSNVRTRRWLRSEGLALKQYSVDFGCFFPLSRRAMRRCVEFCFAETSPERVHALNMEIASIEEKTTNTPRIVVSACVADFLYLRRLLELA